MAATNAITTIVPQLRQVNVPCGKILSMSNILHVHVHVYMLVCVYVLVGSCLATKVSNVKDWYIVVVCTYQFVYSKTKLYQACHL